MPRSISFRLVFMLAMFALLFAAACATNGKDLAARKAAAQARKDAMERSDTPTPSPATTPTDEVQAMPSSGNSSCIRPTRYSQFKLVHTTAELVAAVANSSISAIALAPGNYVLTQPLVINRPSGCLYIHGFNRFNTVISGKGLLLSVQATNLLSLAGLQLKGNAANTEAIRFDARQGTTFEMQDAVLFDAVANITSRGKYTFQGMKIYSGANVPTSVVVDNADADVLLTHIDFIGLGKPHDDPEYCHAHQRAGRLRMYSIQSEGAQGRYEFLFENASALGTHVVAAGRSEGDNTDSTACKTSTLRAMVGMTGSGTEVMLKAFSIHGYYGLSCRKNTAMADMKSVGGRLWLLGNNSHYRVGRMVTGSDKNARIVAMGNICANIAADNESQISTNAAFPILANGKGVKLTDNENQYHRSLNQHLSAKFLNEKAPLTLERTTPNAAETIPDVVVPPSLTLPSLDTDFSGLFLNVKTFGAKGDGTTDDTRAIQAAFDQAIAVEDKTKTRGETTRTTINAALPASCLIYFPTGTYRVTQTLKLLQPSALGGYMGGADSTKVRIVGAFTSPDQALLHLAAWGMSVSGIGFSLATPSRTGLAGLVEIDATRVNGKGGCPSCQILFHKCGFRGGGIGVAMGNHGGEEEGNISYLGSNTDMCMFERCIFAQNQTALTIGHFNSLLQDVFDCTFINNRYGIRNFRRTSPMEFTLAKGRKATTYTGAGTYEVYNSTFKGTKEYDFEVTNAIAGTYFFHGVTTDAVANLRTWSGLEAHIYFYERSHFTHNGCNANTATADFSAPTRNCISYGDGGNNRRSGEECFCFDKPGGGLFFLYSDLSSSQVVFPNDYHRYLILAHSTPPCTTEGSRVREYSAQPTMRAITKDAGGTKGNNQK